MRLGGPGFWNLMRSSADSIVITDVAFETWVYVIRSLGQIHRPLKTALFSIVSSY